MKTTFLWPVLLAQLAAPFLAKAQSVPSLINYQGQVQNPDGTVPPTADYTLTFRIYDAATGGSVVWGPQVFDGVGGPGHGPKIPVVQGYFNVMLGPADTASRSIWTAFSNSTRFLEIKLGTNPPVAPRQQLLSAPYALKADNSAKLAGYDWGDLFGSPDPLVTTAKLPGSKVADASITGAQLAALSVAWNHLGPRPTGTNVGLGGVAMSEAAYSRFTTSSTNSVEVPNLRVTLITQGHPVMVLLGVADLSRIANVSFTRSRTQNPPAIHAVGYLQMLRGTNTIASSEIVLRADASTSDDVLSLSLPPSSFSAVDVAPPGTNTYSIKVKVYDLGHSVDVQNVRLVAYEL